MKKILLSLACGILVLGCGILVLRLLTGFGKNQENNNSNINEKIIYYDDTRTIKDTYTFREATSRFAFKVNTSTLIFEENEKNSLYSINSYNTIQDELMNPQFNYNQDTYTSLSSMYIGESNSTSLDEFITNFKNGVLNHKVTQTVEDIKIIESNKEYVFASWIDKSFTNNYEYYFAKKIGNIIYYVYNNSVIEYNDTKIQLLLNEFKDFFTCLTEDDGQEPYIYDKIMNVPLVLERNIKDVNYIVSISNSENDYLDGSVKISTDEIDSINIEYGASGHYNKIKWAENLDSNMKYLQEGNKNTFGIKDGNITQIFEITIYSNETVTTKKDFNKYINKFLNNK